jgi:hypothetical protein
MSRTLPIELCHTILDCVSYQTSLLDASLVCRGWREYLFLRLFASITIFIEKGPWEDPAYLESRAFQMIAPHICSVTLSSIRNPTIPRGEWMMLTDTNGSLLQPIQAILPVLTNLSHLKFEYIQLKSCDMAYAIMKAGASRQLAHFELVDVDIINPKDFYGRWFGPPYPTVSRITIDRSGGWALNYLGLPASKMSLTSIHLTCDPARSSEQLMNPYDLWVALRECLADDWCQVVDLECNDLVVRRGSSRFLRTLLSLCNASVQRFVIRASTVRGAEQALYIFEISKLSALTHAILHFNLGDEEDADQTNVQWTVDLNNLEANHGRAYPQLKHVQVAMLCPVEQRDDLTHRSGFLRGCEGRGILHMSL